MVIGAGLLIGGNGANAYHWNQYTATTNISAGIRQAEYSAEVANENVVVTIKTQNETSDIIVSPPGAPQGSNGDNILIRKPVSIAGVVNGVLTILPNGTLTSNGNALSCPLSVTFGSGTPPITINC